jgi:hypothetical protein
MIEASAARRKSVVPDVPALAISKRFGNYKPESERVVRNALVAEDKALKKMKKAWNACKYTDGSITDYAKMLKSVKKFGYSAKDVENFSLAFVESQDEMHFCEKAGLFLSALINNSMYSDFVIHTSHLAVPIDHLGYRNTKNIFVRGHVGSDAGHGMEGGAITVEGDAGGHVGDYMRAGIIIVGGNAGRVGYSMDGGTVIVGGNVDGVIGWMMRGGEIRLEGGYGSISDDFKHGRIYHKGKLIVDK